MESKKQINKVECMQIKIKVSLLVLQTKKSTWSVSGNILDYLVKLVGFWVFFSFLFFFFLNASVLSQNRTNAFSVFTNWEL